MNGGHVDSVDKGLLEHACNVHECGESVEREFLMPVFNFHLLNWNTLGQVDSLETLLSVRPSLPGSFQWILMLHDCHVTVSVALSPAVENTVSCSLFR